MADTCKICGLIPRTGLSPQCLCGPAPARGFARLVDGEIDPNVLFPYRPSPKEYKGQTKADVPAVVICQAEHFDALLMGAREIAGMIDSDLDVAKDVKKCIELLTRER